MFSTAVVAADSIIAGLLTVPSPAQPAVRSGNLRRAGLRFVRQLRRHVFGRVPQDHKLARGKWQESVSTPIRSGEFYLERGTIVGHHYCTDLPATQEQRLTCFEMPDRQVFQQSHHIVQVNVVVHDSHDIASCQPRKVFPVSNNPCT